ncbi:MAG: hypothetical protein WCG47_21655, partial [Dermatophilaceae bacterium]
MCVDVSRSPVEVIPTSKRPQAEVTPTSKRPRVDVIPGRILMRFHIESGLGTVTFPETSGPVRIGQETKERDRMPEIDLP